MQGRNDHLDPQHSICKPKLIFLNFEKLHSQVVLGDPFLSQDVNVVFCLCIKQW